LAFGMTYPEEKMFIIPIPFPIKAKWFVMGYIVIELVMAFESPGDGVAHVAHLGGMLFGFFLIRHWRSTARRQSTFDGWNSYQGTAHRDDSATILGRIRKWMHLDREGNHNANTSNNGNFRTTSTHQSDWDYNARRKQEEAEIDAILEKIRRSGYASLTAEEKKKLFEASKK
ncbi:MAG: rhomboid family intramembrane serine protease, partial [Prevotella sp.]|nr:rhomboid family intramembrane serine protease [Prevotella sp.]